MSYVESKTFILPSRDTANSNPQEIEFTSTSDGRIVVAVDDRHLTFCYADLKKLLRISSAVIDEVVEQ
jgi:hypothetical protein